MQRIVTGLISINIAITRVNIEQVHRVTENKLLQCRSWLTKWRNGVKIPFMSHYCLRGAAMNSIQLQFFEMNRFARAHSSPSVSSPGVSNVRFLKKNHHNGWQRSFYKNKNNSSNVCRPPFLYKNSRCTDSNVNRLGNPASRDNLLWHRCTSVMGRENGGNAMDVWLTSSVK